MASTRQERSASAAVGSRGSRSISSSPSCMLTLHETRPRATHWICRSMAKATGVSRSTIQRIWHAHGLQPHRVTRFKLSKDPAFVEQLTDVLELHLNPPDKAVVLCVDEKRQIFGP